MASVLVIDDDRAVLRLVEKTLEDTNHQIITAQYRRRGDGAAAGDEAGCPAAGHHAA